MSLAGAKAFARRYKGDSVVEAQGDGTMPTGWVGKTMTGETLGDVFIATVSGVPALGLRNHEGPGRVYTGEGLRRGGQAVRAQGYLPD